MNKVIIVNLNGAAYQVEEAGYEALRAYLDSASRRLEANPDRAEIIADIEQAIAEKFRALLSAHKNVVTTAEVSRIVTEMGPVEDASTPSPAPESPNAGPWASGTPSPAPAATPKRFYRLPQGEMIFGLCNGAAAYLNMDVTLVRMILVVVVAVSVFGSHPFLSALIWAAAYTFLFVIVPTARTPEEQAAAHGGHDAPRTAQEFIKRAKAGYYEGMKTWNDRDARREWKRKFRQDMRGWKRHFREEMRRQSDHLGARVHHWDWAPLSAVAWIVLPAVALLQILLIGVWILAILSLVNTGFVFGHPLLATMPLWQGLLLLAVVYFLLSMPLRALRSAVTGRYRYNHYSHPAAGLSNALVGVGTVAIVMLVLVHHPHELGRAAGEIWAQIQIGFNSLQKWVSRR